MIALRFIDNRLQLVRNAPVPAIPGEALVRVLAAGICNTDLEIVKGYSAFSGTIGHEFVGVVQECPDASLKGRRVVGEINAGCGTCPLCLAGDPRHCPDRTTLGIHGRGGAFADYLSLPVRNLLTVPDTITNRQAVFAEPLAAACEILDQAPIGDRSRVAVIGDGKLGQLAARALATTGCDLTVFGKHPAKLALLKGRAQIRTVEDLPIRRNDRFEFVVEASGSPSGLDLALDLVRPRGWVVAKSTFHGPAALNLSRVVVDEITIVGSRCGRFGPALRLLETAAVSVDDLISAEFPLEEGIAAVKCAGATDVIKVLLRPAAQS
jgi:threonine dehydrogenase-like Zn-dependent dehydrogenase